MSTLVETLSHCDHFNQEIICIRVLWHWLSPADEGWETAVRERPPHPTPKKSYTQAYVHTHIHTGTHANTEAHTYTRTHTGAHTHTHTYMHPPSPLTITSEEQRGQCAKQSQFLFLTRDKHPRVHQRSDQPPRANFDANNIPPLDSRRPIPPRARTLYYRQWTWANLTSRPKKKKKNLKIGR